MASATVSVSRGTVTTLLTEHPVSVLNGRTLDRSIGQSPPVSVMFGRSLEQSVAESAPVSVTLGPVIAGIAPNQLMRGNVTTITVSGSNLNGATALRFIKSDGALDSTITVSDITVNPAGDSLTASVSVNAGAPLGQRVVMVEAAAGMSPGANAGPNVIQIITP